MHRYSWLQGRYPRTTLGDSFLWMRRHAERPNVVSQPIRNLTPGPLYSLNFIAADCGDLQDGRSERKTPALGVRIDGGETLPGPTFTSTVPNNYAQTIGPFTTDHPAYLTHYRIIFRATAEAGRLAISD